MCKNANFILSTCIYKFKICNIPVTIVHVHCHMDWFSNIYLRNQNKIDYRQGKSKGGIEHVWYSSAVGFFKEQEIIHLICIIRR